MNDRVSTALTTRVESAALVTFDDIARMAEVMARASLFGIKTTEQYMTLMFIAQAEGQHPATVAQDYDIIQGRPARKTHSVLARFQSAGGSVQWHDFTETVVSGTFTHPKGGSLKVDWTIEMAKKAGLDGKDNWKKTPRAMLRARCIAEGVRATFPAALGGHLITEEAADLGLAELGAPKVTGEVIDATTGEITGARPTPAPTWPAEAFSLQFPRWEKAVDAGMKTVDDIVALARSKGALTPEQEKSIRAIGTPPAAKDEEPHAFDNEPDDAAEPAGAA
jgi:hypothetical protein